MAIVCPTVTCQSDDLHEYRRQMERIENLSKHIHVDLMDGDFAPSKSPNIDSIWFPEDVQVDLHIMYRDPSDVLNTVIELKPRLLIIHSEANGDPATLSDALQVADIKFGVALLQDTPVSTILDQLEYVDHVLIFSGVLGRFGGEANLGLLSKVAQLKKYKPNIEIGWDGGINADNVRALVDGGVDILSVGGFIQNAEDPRAAYNNLVERLKMAPGV